MRTQLRFITTAAIAVALPLGLGGCSSSSKKSAATTTPGTTVASSTAGTTVAGSDGVTIPVGIKGFAFNPDSLNVKVGTKVTWTNQDGFAHTVYEQDGPVKFDSGHINSQKSFSFTFKKPGTYKYICGIHNYMSGTVTVTTS